MEEIKSRLGEKSYILALDHGTSGPKTAIVSATGKVEDLAFRECPLHLPEPGAAEHDPNDWWNGFIDGAKEVLSKGHVSVDDIVGICNTSQWSGTVPVDANGNTRYHYEGTTRVRDQVLFIEIDP